ncbi:MAG: hypothetical protein JWO48_3296 [Bryobacterales bacterium]|nr:hypothetical protein [Bryobacterales bacterium]
MNEKRDWPEWREKQAATPIYLPPQIPTLVYLPEYHN